MKSQALSRTCRHCRYYTPEGRRGGYCNQLNVEVQGGWKACAVSLPPFSPVWENFQGIMAWQNRAIAMQESEPVSYAANEFVAQSEIQPALSEHSVA
jgi:hypothetical protein